MQGCDECAQVRVQQLRGEWPGQGRCAMSKQSGRTGGVYRYTMSKQSGPAVRKRRHGALGAPVHYEQAVRGPGCTGTL